MYYHNKFVWHCFAKFIEITLKIIDVSGKMTATHLSELMTVRRQELRS